MESKVGEAAGLLGWKIGLQKAGRSGNGQGLGRWGGIGEANPKCRDL